MFFTQSDQPCHIEDVPVIMKSDSHLESQLLPDLSASLQGGLFDTEADNLQTCSLPDLRVLFALTPGDSPLRVQEGSGESPEAQNEALFDNVIESVEGDEESLVQSSDEGDPGMEDVNVEEFPSDEEEEAWFSSDEDDDLQQLVETLQSFVNEASELCGFTHVFYMASHPPVDFAIKHSCRVSSPF